MTEQERQWHWGEGNKYALECMKAVLLLNGGGALSLLSFFGGRPRMLTTIASEAIGNALFSFGIGAIGSVLLFLFAYMTQLHYGNEGTQIRPGRQAVIWHNLAYVAVLISVGGFICGVWFARRAVIAVLI
jgi:hypothetical protein